MSGRRNLLWVAGTLAALATAPMTWASGGTYEVVQCDPMNRATSGVALEDAPAYAVRQMCDDPQNDHAIKITNTTFARNGRSGRVRWSTGSPALRIVGARVQARLRRDKGHVPRLYVADALGHELARMASGVSEPTNYLDYSWHSSTIRPEQFVAHLRCQRADGCQQSDLAKTWLRNVHFTVADYANPVIQATGGTMLSPGWVRGRRNLLVGAGDTGSGIRRIVETVNGHPLLTQYGSCNGVIAAKTAAVFGPCPSQLEIQGNFNTTAAPFRDGSNTLTVCVVDFAGNPACTARSVRVDDTPPSIAFANAQDWDDPELIRASVLDATSGVARGQIYYRREGSTTWHRLDTQLEHGELRTRVNSTADPPGRYEFLATATDVAGNWTLSDKRADGEPMILTFPLKTEVNLSGHLTGGASHLTVNYGRPSTVGGTLRDAAGAPLANQGVTVTEQFAEGALIDRRVRTVTTDSQGRWQERLPAGPSRSVTASYDGSRRYLSDATQVGRLQVRTKATLRLSRRKVREGHRVAFTGKVGHLAARVPSGGKLVELEVKDGHSWQTVRHPFYTRPDGKYALKYRFARFYTRNVHYRFRVKALREHEWPYKTPASSGVRELVVTAR